jgi:hypothetical protein
LLLAALPTALSVVLEFAGLVHPSNLVRAALPCRSGWLAGSSASRSSPTQPFPITSRLSHTTKPLWGVTDAL